MVANNNPFLDLLKEENLRKIKIDRELIPFFKIVITKIGNYFASNNLLNAKNFSELFKKYLLTEGPKQHSISFQTLGNPGEYDYRNKAIKVSSSKRNKEVIIDDLCHKIIHFLVMADTLDSMSYDAKIFDATIFNEGLTQLLTMKVLGTLNRSSYTKEVWMSQFYLAFQNENEAFSDFLNNRFSKRVNSRQLAMNSERYYSTYRESDLLEVQNEIISGFLKSTTINSFDKFIMILNSLNQRLFMILAMLETIMQ